MVHSGCVRPYSIPCVCIEISVPALPLTSCSSADNAPMTARRRGSRENWQAASTFGCIEPASKRSALRAFFSDFPCVASPFCVFGIAAGSPPSLRDGDLLRPHRSPYCLRARSLSKSTEKCSNVRLANCDGRWRDQRRFTRRGRDPAALDALAAGQPLLWHWRRADEGGGISGPFSKRETGRAGYVEAARHLPEILWLRRAFKRTLRAAPPSVFVGVDAPDFNLGLECALRRAGIPTVHFISPSIWAWRGARIHKIKRATDLMLCVFPFETEIYARAGIVHRYVGHPLADLIPFKPDPMAARRTLGLPESRPAIVAVLPGSRNSEIARIAPVFFAAMARMHERGRRLRFVMPAASPAIRGALQRLAGRYPQLPLSLIDGHSHRALEACDAA